MKKTNKNKITFHVILYLIMAIFAVAIIYFACKKYQMAMMAMPLKMEFTGEYSQDGESWQAYEKGQKISSLDGNLVLRGGFGTEFPEGMYVNLHLDHIGVGIYKNGELVFQSGVLDGKADIPYCGNYWTTWETPELKAEDTLEIHLYNPHQYGNPDAYHEFLDSFYLGGKLVLKEYLQKDSMASRIAGNFIIIVSIALIGTAIGYILLRLPHSGLLLKLGIMSGLMGEYIYLDTKDIDLRFGHIIMTTFIRQFCLMFAVCLLGACVVDFLWDKRKRIGGIAVYGLVLATFVLMVVTACNKMVIYDTGIYFAIAQAIVGLVLLVLSFREMKHCQVSDRIRLGSCMILIAVFEAEWLNAYTGWWKSGAGIKAVFTALFVFHVIWAVKIMAVNYRASLQAKKLEEDLKQSRIDLAISQIQPHFIYNLLNSIYHLCDKDTKMAQQVISDFSEYLQCSLNAVNQTAMIAFEEELKHIKTYLNLEEMRFGEDLKVEYDIHTMAFLLPALSVQPLVENAVKHGICKKDGGGTVRITSRELEDCCEIVISDDGIGFDTERACQGEGTHMGIKNVRQRLQVLCNGELEIKSEPGKGTVSIIHIPITQ